jgi:hypothetical protein
MNLKSKLKCSNRRIMEKKRFVVLLLCMTILLSMFSSASAATPIETVRISSFFIMDSKHGVSEKVGLVETGLDETALKALSQTEIEAYAHSYLATIENSTACNHSWVLKSTEYMWYSGPGPDGYYKGWAWVPTYDCSRCGAWQRIVMI